jgi:type IV secretion system protein VirB4
MVSDPMKTLLSAAGSIHTEVQPCAFVDDGVFVTKSGEAGIVMLVSPSDSECLESMDMASVAQRFEAAMRMFGRSYRVYQYLIKRRRREIPHSGAHAGTWDRAEYLEGKTLFFFEHYVVILHGNAQTGFGGRSWVSGRNTVKVATGAVRAAASAVRHQAEALALQLRDVVPMVVADKQAAYRFLRRLLNYDPLVADSVPLNHDEYLDYFGADSAVEGHRGFLRVGDHYARVLTLKDPPASSSPDVLRSLRELPAECIVCTEWRAVESHDARQLVSKKIAHFHRSKYVVNIMATVMSTFTSNHQQERPEDMQKDQAANAMEAQLGELLADVESSGAQLGEFALTVIVHDTDPDRLGRATAEAFKSFAARDAILYEEKQNVLAAWLATIPGGYRNQFRSLYLTNRNYADLSLLFAPATGDVRNGHLRAEYLAALETRQQTPYFLNLHYQDVSHTLITGMTGSGKSFACSFLLEQAQKYGPRTVIFDLGGSYRDLAARLAGSYMTIGIERNQFTINPFSLKPTRENLHFLFSFVRVLIESGGFEMDGAAAKALHETIENVYHLDADVRRLRTVAACLPVSLRPHLARWVDGGQYAELFDNPRDSLTCSTFQVFDFEGLDRYPEILEPLLFYILHRSNTCIYDPAELGTFKLFLLDEAWRFFRNPTVKAYVTEALKTWRKRNAAMLLATQSSGDLEQSDMLQTVAESCGTMIFLANPRMDREHYKTIFRLNDVEAELIATLQPKREMLIKRPDCAKVVRLEVPTAAAAGAASKHKSTGAL